jgi:hypothetical protein
MERPRSRHSRASNPNTSSVFSDFSDGQRERERKKRENSLLFVEDAARHKDARDTLVVCVLLLTSAAISIISIPRFTERQLEYGGARVLGRSDAMQGHGIHFYPPTGTAANR